MGTTKYNSNGEVVSSVEITEGVPTEISGSASTLNGDAIVAQDVGQCTDATVQLVGTWAGTATFQSSNDGTNWVSTAGYPLSSPNSVPVVSSTANGMFLIPTGFKYFRVRMTAYTSGTCTAYYVGNRQSTQLIGVGGSTVLAAGSAIVGVVKLVGSNNGGATSHRRISTADTNLVNVKATQGALFGIRAQNVSASDRFLKIYSKATAPVLASDVPIITVKIPAGLAVVESYAGDFGCNFTSGISFAITGLIGDTDTTAIAAGDVYLTLFYV